MPTEDIRLVSSNGFIRWRTQRIFLSTNLSGDHVALSETEQGRTSIRYAALILGDVDPETMRFTPNVRWGG